MWYIIRHGETSHNKLGIKQGHYPSILNKKGIEQSRDIANKLLESEENFHNFKFVTSPMLRTRQTIEIIMNILKIKNEAIHENLIMSKSKGVFENLSKKFIKKNFPEEINRNQKDYWNYAPPKGESYARLYPRVVKFVKKYKQEENLIIVLHSSSSPIIRGLLQNKSKRDIIKYRLPHKQNCFYKWDGYNIIKIKI